MSSMDMFDKKASRRGGGNGWFFLVSRREGRGAERGFQFTYSLNE